MRWLSLTESLNRVLLLWEPLREYYLENGDGDEKAYFEPRNEIQLRILAILLGELGYYNREFQTTTMFYDQIFRNLTQSFLTFSDFVLSTEAKSLEFNDKFKMEWDYKNTQKIQEHLKDINQFFSQFTDDYTDIKLLMNQVDENSRFKIFKSCQKFIIRVLVEMKKYFPFKKEILKDCDVVFLKYFDKEKWKTLASKFKNIVTLDNEREFIGELGRFERVFADIKGDAKGENILTSWSRLRQNYKYMGELVKAILVLPHTTVPVERLFSNLKDFKTQRRNRLSTENLEACLLIYQKFGEAEFLVTPAMLNRYDNLWKKPVKKLVEEKKPEDTFPRVQQIQRAAENGGGNVGFLEQAQNSSFFGPMSQTQNFPYFFVWNPHALNQDQNNLMPPSANANNVFMFQPSLLTQPSSVSQTSLPIQSSSLLDEASSLTQPSSLIQPSLFTQPSLRTQPSPIIEEVSHDSFPQERSTAIEEEKSVTADAQPKEEKRRQKKSKAKEPLDQAEFNKTMNDKIRSDKRNIEIKKT